MNTARLELCSCGLHGVLYDSAGLLGPGIVSKSAAYALINEACRDGHLTPTDTDSLGAAVRTSSLTQHCEDVPPHFRLAFSLWYEQFLKPGTIWTTTPCVLIPFLATARNMIAAHMN